MLSISIQLTTFTPAPNLCTAAGSAAATAAAAAPPPPPAAAAAARQGCKTVNEFGSQPSSSTTDLLITEY
jgi:hypothetical protein